MKDQKIQQQLKKSLLQVISQIFIGEEVEALKVTQNIVDQDEIAFEKIKLRLMRKTEDN